MAKIIVIAEDLLLYLMKLRAMEELGQVANLWGRQLEALLQEYKEEQHVVKFIARPISIPASQGSFQSLQTLGISFPKGWNFERDISVAIDEKTVAEQNLVFAIENGATVILTHCFQLHYRAAEQYQQSNVLILSIIQLLELLRWELLRTKLENTYRSRADVENRKIEPLEISQDVALKPLPEKFLQKQNARGSVFRSFITWVFLFQLCITAPVLENRRVASWLAIIATELVLVINGLQLQKDMGGQQNHLIDQCISKNSRSVSDLGQAQHTLDENDADDSNASEGGLGAKRPRKPHNSGGDPLVNPDLSAR